MGEGENEGMREGDSEWVFELSNLFAKLGFSLRNLAEQL